MAHNGTPKLDGLGNPLDPNALYYVQDSRQVVGNCALWWRAESAGYTCEIGEAGWYSGTEAASMRETDIPWPVGEVEKIVVRHVRAEGLAKLREGRPVAPTIDLQAHAAEQSTRLHAAIDKALRQLQVGQFLAVSEPRLVHLGDAGREIRCELLVLQPGEAPPAGRAWTVYGPATADMLVAMKAPGRDGLR